MTSFKAKHGRPKPPPICSWLIFAHMRKYGTCRVHYYDGLWWVEHTHAKTVGFRDHTDALTYAHKLTQERSQE